MDESETEYLTVIGEYDTNASFPATRRGRGWTSYGLNLDQQKRYIFQSWAS
jgi:hypothetical protein